MASFLRSVAPFIRPTQTNPKICAQCRRSFLTSRPLYSGHNKWSKIRHGKAANDAVKTRVRSQASKDIVLASQLYGPDPNMNPQLATAIAAAKKASVPKAVIEVAIARGQGRSSSGTALEPMLYEAMMPPGTAIIVDVQTESKTRVLQDLNQMVKKANGAQGTSKFFFTRAGRVIFEKGGPTDIDKIMDDAIEAGAEDLENDEAGNIVVWTEPSQTMQVSKVIAAKFGLNVLESGIVWSANEDTKVRLDSSVESTILADLLAAMSEYPDVQAIYCNATKGNMTEEEWERIEENLGT
ncbi:transcriptional regulator TACO1-like protein [Apodospora peruviana]|uniref:Transcriptional regulator TACO1-like protein n=1 Tax=Apodospora peruviana TaxID=516989 RepID=A0AAE0M7K7_9PEZI|nr:transcriptional regulator TACO1-like protein [Apodospora peruviana]